jgi:hypothetical protein
LNQSLQGHVARGTDITVIEAPVAQFQCRGDTFKK